MRYLTLIFLLCGFFVTLSTAKDNNISLSQTFSKEQLSEMLIPLEQWHPFPKADEREAWNALPKEIREEFSRISEEYLNKDMPVLPATVYLDFKRDGNRSRYEQIYFDRRQRLNDLVIAECLEGEGRLLDAISNTLWAICEESSWVVPAHAYNQKAGVGLPDVNEPIIDLFAAQTAECLAWTYYLLGDELKKISPLIPQRIQDEIHKRILKPFMERDNFGWMGFEDRKKGKHPNNWNPWINSNVLACGLLVEKDANQRMEIVKKVLCCLDNFVVPYPSDGGCDEGPGYWDRAGGSLFDNLELMDSATKEKFNFYKNPLIKEIGRFIYRVYIANHYFVCLGDCSAKLGISYDLVYRYGKQIKDPVLQGMGAFEYQKEGISDAKKSIALGRSLFLLFDTKELQSYKKAKEPFVKRSWLGDEGMQMMTARDQDGSSKGLFVAAWGGHNAQSHNHNDVGNVILFADGNPVLIDVGSPKYTAKTFSSKRYEIWAFQSAYHNLPTINGLMQNNGLEYAAKNVQYKKSESTDELIMDIASAYSKDAGIDFWLRKIRLNRKKNVQITDSFQLKNPSSDIVENFVTCCTVSQLTDGQLVLENPKTQTKVMMQFPFNKLRWSVETIDVQDGRLSNIWGEKLFRIQFKPKGAVSKDEWSFQLKMEKSPSKSLKK